MHVAQRGRGGGGGDRTKNEAKWRGKVERQSGEAKWRGIVERQSGEAKWSGKVERQSGAKIHGMKWKECWSKVGEIRLVIRVVGVVSSNGKEPVVVQVSLFCVH
ncbi:hypothetical protein POVWA2_030990 [Plasmodium ovale wallikeri]|uniref:Uncharacterized protein n=1 Tax=Plasmodium ovale wallikeri TaxID=864142 RepID=A0A1A8YYQ6_PLAOA|nr:hypothetical protein POVWA2_030990 [Plasmodium ovale wallikeri]